MTLSNYLKMANVPYIAPPPINTLEVVEDESVCRFSLFPWLRSQTALNNIDDLLGELVSSNLNSSECIIKIIRIPSPQIYQLILEVVRR